MGAGRRSDRQDGAVFAGWRGIRPGLPVRLLPASTQRRREAAWAYLFLLPYLIGLVVFVLGPIIAAFGLSLTQWDLFTPPQFDGLAQYERVLQDERFWQALRNTLYYAVLFVPLETLAVLALAQLVNTKLRGMQFFRSLLLAPSLVTGIAAALLWSWLFNYDVGLINYYTAKLGLPALRWLHDPNSAMASIVIMSLWRTLGFDAMIFLAGLQSIPADYYEAARIDGSTWWTEFWQITVPLLSFTTFFVVVTGVIWSFKLFDLIFALTDGGPAGSTMTLVYYIYIQGFRRLNMGYAAAISYALFVIVLVITLIQWKLQDRWVHYE